MPGDAEHTLGVILAGGAGKRVGGSDKGLLPLCDRPLVEHVLDNLRPQCDRVLIVANRNLGDYSRYAPVLHDEGEGHAGPLAGLVAAFRFIAANRHALPDAMLTAPVDCPDPPRDLAARLREALAQNPGADCTRVRHAGRLRPLFAVYRIGTDPAWWIDSARAALHEHGSPSRWHAALDALVVDFGDSGDAFHDLDTPAEFRAFERRHDSN